MIKCSHKFLSSYITPAIWKHLAPETCVQNVITNLRIRNLKPEITLNVMNDVKLIL